MKTIAIVNQKGGSGKTTTAISLSSALSLRGQRTLLVDLDPQSHCASGLAIPESQIDLQIGDVMMWPDGRPLPTERFVWRTRSNLHVAPSTTKLAGLESARGGLAAREDRDVRLLRVLNELRDEYDWCVIDCPPYIGLLTFNALRAADEVLIPVETGYFALQGAGKQVATIEAMCRRSGRSVPYRLLPTMYDRSSSVADDVLESIRSRFSEALAPVVVRTDEKVREATSMGTPVTEFAPTSSAAKDYAALASYIMEHAPAAVVVGEPVGAGEVLFGERGPGAGPLGAAQSSVGGGGGLFDTDEYDGDGEDAEETRGWEHTGDMLGGVVAMDGSSDEASAPADRPRARESLSRAAELAAKARQLAARSAEISKKIERDPDVARVIRELDRPAATRGVLGGGEHPPPPSAGVPTSVSVPSSSSGATGSRMKFGAIMINGGVLFAQPGGPEMEFCIAGDHNGWVPSATRLVFNPERERHEAFVVANPGPMRYRLVVNGEWMADPYNPNAQANPYGGRDSIVVVGGVESTHETGGSAGR